jgi:NSS family neurotransmitter:Na+ symporter
MREKLASRIGFIFLSAGCAIGLGNVWRFPYVAGKSGGGWFVLIYLASLIMLGIPVLVMEFAAGRAAQRSIAKVHETLVPDKKAWRLHGICGFLGCVILMMFYTVVTGWMVLYFLKMAMGSFDGLDTGETGNVFGEMLADPVAMSVTAVGITLAAAAVCAIGLQKGLERVSKFMMGALLSLVLVLVARSVMLPGAEKGVSFFLIPDFAKMQDVGIVRVVVDAMNQAFFTLSLGIGCMAIFGSYIGRDRTMLGEALSVVALDTFAAVSSGLVVIPACFAFGIAPAQGPGLIFVTLPNVFNAMPLGRLWGALFFLFMSFAALTTVLAVFENVAACIMDFAGISRRRACAATFVLIGVLSLPCAFGFNIWSPFHPLGEGSCVLDLEDFLVSDVLLPLGAIAFALFCTRRYGWGWKRFLAETNAGKGPKFPESLRLYCAYCLPAIVLLIFVSGILRRFHVMQ